MTIAHFEALPGGNWVSQGLADLANSHESVPALLVSIGEPRLRRRGIELPGPPLRSPEHRLYERLFKEAPATAHSRYNAFIRRLVSFERALERAR